MWSYEGSSSGSSSCSGGGWLAGTESAAMVLGALEGANEPLMDGTSEVSDELAQSSIPISKPYSA